MSLVSLLIAAVLCALFLFVLDMLPMPPKIKRVIIGVLAVLFCIWLILQFIPIIKTGNFGF